MVFPEILNKEQVLESHWFNHEKHRVLLYQQQSYNSVLSTELSFLQNWGLFWSVKAKRGYHEINLLLFGLGNYLEL